MEAPHVERVTHHSVLLRWKPPERAAEAGPLYYTVQEEEVAKNAGYRDAYTGYSTSREFCGLSTLSQYRYRVRASNDEAWSAAVTIATTRQPKTSENLHRAVQAGDTASVRIILEESPQYTDTPDNFGCSPLMSACRLGKTPVVEVLLDMGANVEYCSASGKTSLMEGCYHGHLPCVELLIERGATWLARDHAGCSALHWAVDGGHTDVVSFALSQGVPVDDVDSATVAGWTPLMRTASVGGNVDVAKILIANGADTNKRDRTGKTVLMLAALNGFDELAKLLLDNGSDLTATNEYGKTALDFAVSLEREETVQLLQKAKQLQ